MSAEKIKEDIMQGVHEATRALHEEIKKHGENSAQAKEMAEKVDSTMKQYDEANQKLLEQLKRTEKDALEAKERIENLELKVIEASQTDNGKAWKNGEEYKAWQDFAKTGDLSKTLRTDVATSGGYLVPNEMDSELLRLITEMSPMRAFCRIKTIGSKTLETAKRTSIPVATYEGEAETGTTSQSGYGKVTQTVHRLTFTSEVTNEELMNNAFDMETLMSDDATEAFAVGEGYNFIVGTGIKSPEGITVNATLRAAAYTTAGSGVVTIADLIAAQGELKVGQNPMWGWNRQTLANLRGKTDAQGQFLWQPSVAAGSPGTLLGAPYAIFQDMPSIAANAYSIFYGDLRRGYRITDRTGLSVIRDPYSQKKHDIIEFTWNRYNDGQVILEDAIKLIKIKA